MSKKIYIKTYGCQMNVYDSDKICDVMRMHDFSVTNDLDMADLIVFNTCSVREKAEDKLFSDVGRLAKLKKVKPNLAIAIGGCVASQEGKEILKKSNLINIVFGPQTLHRLPALYVEYLRTLRPQLDISFPEIEKFDHLPETNTTEAKAYLTIMEGCSKYCSFCIVPYTRGPEISRPFDDVLADAAVLEEKGVAEIYLLGQNVNDYRGRMHQGGYASLATLINYISSLEGLKRIRFTTSHPKAFSDDLIEAYKNNSKLANQLHLPVQSGSNRILELMKRGYRIEEFKEKIQKLRLVRPDISITTDIIVGFPGETDEDFQETLNLVDEIVFDSAFSFIYSKRPGTPASLMDDNVDQETKKLRLNILQQKLQRQFENRSFSMEAKIYQVLIEGLNHGKTHLCGRTECNRLVHLNNETNLDLIGKILPILIIKASPHALYGVLT